MTAPLPSDRVVVQAPMSLSGSYLRLRELFRFPLRCANAALGTFDPPEPGAPGWVRPAKVALLMPTLLTAAALLFAAVWVLIAVAWAVVLAWYVCFGLLLVPYRLIRRGDRGRKVEAQRHHELLESMEDRR